MTAKQLAEWLLSLPPHLQKAEINSVIGNGIPSTAKRVMAVEVGDHGVLIIVESMGTHLLPDSPYWKFVSYIEHGGKVFNRA